MVGKKGSEKAVEAAVMLATDGALKGIGKIAGKFKVKPSGSFCFAAGTLVAAEKGQKPIEEVKVGDFVYSENPETGEKGLKKVVRTFVNETEELIHVKVSGQTIQATPEHPFYVPQKGWTDVVDLRAGDILVTVNGEYQVVERIQHELLESPIQVYNFEVEDFHTYYVGEDSVLVHNTCANPSKANSKIWKKFKNHKNGTKTSGTGKKKQYYEWDYTHNDIEVCNSNKKHLGSMDPTTGKMYKPAVKGRKLEY